MLVGLFQPVHLLILGVIAILVTGPWIVYNPCLQRALKKCSPESRTMSPGKVWRLLIPFFNAIWHFFVVSNMTRSLGNEFKPTNLADADPMRGKSVGLCDVCSVPLRLHTKNRSRILDRWACLLDRQLGKDREALTGFELTL